MSKVMVVSFQSLTASSGQGMARLGYSLSKELHKRGLLKTFVVHSKGKFDTPFPSEPVSLLSRYYLYILNKWYRIFNVPTHKFRFVQEVLFDWFCSRKIDNSFNMLFVTQPYLYRTFKKAKKLGITTVLLSGTPEDNYIFDLVTEENKKLGCTEIDAYTYEIRNRYFNRSMKYLDMLVGSLPTVYKTYAASRAFKGKNIELVGHMTPDFPPYDVKERKPIGQKFVVGYLAYTVVLKGLQYLLEAWDNLLKENHIEDIELMIGGPMHPVVETYVKQNFSHLKQVSYTGQVNDIASFMKRLDLFVAPSLVDGAPVSALEAAHYAVPVLITDNAGSSELIARNAGGGYVIPIRDAEAIKKNILWAYQHKEENAQKGLNAKHNMDHYSFEEFITQIADRLEKELHEK